MNRKKYNQIKARLFGCALVLGILLSGGCKDEELFPEYAGSGPLEVEEGVEGKLSILLASDAYQKRNVMARNSPYEHSEQHVHSVYLFVMTRAILSTAVLFPANIFRMCPSMWKK